jgi:hypothetical protein
VLWRIRAWIISLESPMITKSMTFLLIAWFNSCQRASASARLLESSPSPQA